MQNLIASRSAPLFVIIWALIFLSILVFDWVDVWQMLRVPVKVPIFADLRTVQGSINTVSLGFDPQIFNPGDPWGRPMNYPAIWSYIASKLRLNIELNYLIFVSAMLVTFFWSCYRLLDSTRSATFLLICFSGSTLLAVERGNSDLLMFSLLFFAATSNWLGSVLALVMAVALKIYPVLAFPAFFGEAKANRFGIMAIALLSVLIFVWPESHAIRSSTPVNASLSYGALSLSLYLQQFDFSVPSIVISAILCLSVVLVFYFAKSEIKLKMLELNPIVVRLFLIGACIYLGSFILASNYDYRLIFLFFCVPLVVKLEDFFLRGVLLLTILIASNYIPLLIIFGDLGVILNWIAKIILFVGLGSIVMLLLSERVLVWLMINR